MHNFKRRLRYFNQIPFISLRRYHDRYFPENFHYDDRHEYEEDIRERASAPVRHQVALHSNIRKLESLLKLFRSQPKPVVRTQQQQPTAGYRQQQNAYRSPDDINISLQQRRPYFAQTTPRYEQPQQEDDEYSYEKK